MKRMRCLAFAITATILPACLATESTWAQQATISSPFHRIGDSFSENIHSNWGLNFRNGFFRFGSPAGAGVGPQGGGANVGFNTSFGGGNGFFNLSAGQGSRRSMVSETPSVTIMNGGTGVISDTSQRPFVISVVPVVGDIPSVPQPQFGPPQISVLQQRLGRLHAEGKTLGSPSASDSGSRATPVAGDAEPALRMVNDAAVARNQPSSATAPAASVAAILAHNEREDEAIAAAEQQEIELLVQRGERAVAEGRRGAARVYFQMAARRSSGSLSRQLQARADELND